MKHGICSVCRVNGIIYQLGDHVPSEIACQNCYCSYGGVKRCKKIHCSPVMEGCIPIIPEGHCCPVEYKCHGGTKARVDTSLEKEVPILDEATTTESPLANATGLPWLTTSSDDISTDPVDSELVESTSSVSIELKSADLIKDSHLSELDGKKPLESIDRSLESGKAIDKPVPLSVPASTIAPPASSSPSPLSSTNQPVDSSTQEVRDGSSHSVQIEGRNSPHSDPTDLSVDATSTSSTVTSSSTTSTPSPEANFTSTLSSHSNSSESSSIPPSNTTTTSSHPPSTSNSSVAPTEATPTTTPAVTTTRKPFKLYSRFDEQTEPSLVGLILGEVIESLERRIQSSLPAESRLPIDKKATVMNEFNKRPADGLFNFDSQNPSSNSPDRYALALPTNDQGRDTFSSKNDSLATDKPIVNSILVKPEADESLKSIGSSLDSSNVELITAAAPLFHDIAQPDSILVNLSSSSFKVSTDDFKNDKPISIGPSKPMKTIIFGSVDSVNLTNQTDPVKPTTMYNLGSDDWRVINHNHRPNNRNDPFETFGIKYRSEDMDAAEDFNLSINNTTDLDKKSRSETDSESSSVISSFHPGPGYIHNPNFMSFGPGDVSNGFPFTHNKPNSSSNFVRIPANRKPINKQKLPSMMTMCRINGQEFANGAPIPKKNPCLLCRCFNGRELCHQQSCPLPTRPGCKAEPVEGYCCPRFSCINPDDTSSINPAITMHPGLQPFQKVPPVQSQLPQSFQGVPVQPHKYIPLSGLPVFDESERPKEINSNPKPNNNSNLPSNQVPKEKTNATHSEASLTNTRPQQHPSAVVNSPSIHSNISKNRIHFPIGKPEPTIDENRNANNGSTSQGIPILMPARLPNLFHHLVKQSNLHHNGPKQPSPPNNNMPQPDFNYQLPSRPQPTGPRKPSWPSPNGPQSRPGPQHRPYPDMNRFTVPTARPEFAISTTSIDLLRITKPTTTEKDINAQTPATAFNLPSGTSTPSATPSTPTPIPSTSDLPFLTSSHISPSSTPKPLLTDGDSVNIVDPFLERVLDQSGRKPSLPAIDTYTNEKSKPTSESDSPSNTPNGMNPSPWDALRVSGCNIYGTYYKVDQVIDKLSTSCKKCICSSFGVHCTNIC